MLTNHQPWKTIQMKFSAVDFFQLGLHFSSCVLENKRTKVLFVWIPSFLNVFVNIIKLFWFYVHMFWPNNTKNYVISCEFPFRSVKFEIFEFNLPLKFNFIFHIFWPYFHTESNMIMSQMTILLKHTLPNVPEFIEIGKYLRPDMFSNGWELCRHMSWPVPLRMKVIPWQKY